MAYSPTHLVTQVARDARDRAVAAMQDDASTRSGTRSADAERVLIAARTAIRQIHRTAGEPTHQRFVWMGDVRVALQMTRRQFDDAVRELTAAHEVWLRTPGASTRQQDREAVRVNGTDYHEISSDPASLDA